MCSLFSLLSLNNVRLRSLQSSQGLITCVCVLNKVSFGVVEERMGDEELEGWSGMWSSRLLIWGFIKIGRASGLSKYFPQRSQEKGEVVDIGEKRPQKEV